MLKLGSHISFKAPNYLPGAVEESLNNKANCMMIYLGAPQSSRRIDVEKYKLEEYVANYRDKIKPEDIVIHAPYIVNPASLDEDKSKFAKEFLIKEIERMNYIGAKYLVLHPGAHTKFNRDETIKQLIKNLKEIISKTKDVEISIETMAGKGTEIGISFEELKEIVDGVNSDRISVCLDTCHVWDAGYDLNKADEVINKLKEFDLLKLINVIHVNDSKNPLGAAKDRHENIGEGYIGKDVIKSFIHRKEFKDAIMILETPWKDGKPIYDKEIEMLK